MSRSYLDFLLEVHAADPRFVQDAETLRTQAVTRRRTGTALIDAATLYWHSRQRSPPVGLDEDALVRWGFATFGAAWPRAVAAAASAGIYKCKEDRLTPEQLWQADAAWLPHARTSASPDLDAARVKVDTVTGQAKLLAEIPPIAVDSVPPIDTSVVMSRPTPPPLITDQIAANGHWLPPGMSLAILSVVPTAQQLASSVPHTAQTYLVAVPDMVHGDAIRSSAQSLVPAFADVARPLTDGQRHTQAIVRHVASKQLASSVAETVTTPAPPTQAPVPDEADHDPDTVSSIADELQDATLLLTKDSTETVQSPVGDSARARPQTPSVDCAPDCPAISFAVECLPDSPIAVTASASRAMSPPPVDVEHVDRAPDVPEVTGTPIVDVNTDARVVDTQVHVTTADTVPDVAGHLVLVTPDAVPDEPADDSGKPPIPVYLATPPTEATALEASVAPAPAVPEIDKDVEANGRGPLFRVLTSVDVADVLSAWADIVCPAEPDPVYATMLLYGRCLCQEVHTDYHDAAEEMFARTCSANGTDTTKIKAALSSPWIVTAHRRSQTVEACKTVLATEGIAPSDPNAPPYEVLDSLVSAYMLARFPELSAIADDVDKGDAHVDAAATTAIATGPSDAVAGETVSVEKTVVDSSGYYDQFDWPDVPYEDAAAVVKQVRDRRLVASAPRQLEPAMPAE